MDKEINNFRNNSVKCLFNKYGYCKYREDCRKQHFLGKCSDLECDQECNKRHPKECNRGESCKFLKKKICSYEHENRRTSNVKNDEADKSLQHKFESLEKAMMTEIKDLKVIIENERKEIKVLKAENEKKSKDIKTTQNELKNVKLSAEIIKKETEEQKRKLELLESKVTEVENYNIKGKLVSEEISINEFSSHPPENEIHSEKLNESNITKESPEQILDRLRKPKRKTKSTLKEQLKEESENIAFKEFVNESDDILDLRVKCGLDNTEHKCKKCEYQSHSEGHLKIHKRTIHNLKENVESIICGFKADTIHHAYLLETMGENVDKFTCDKCEFKTHSKGNFTIHNSDLH